MSLEKKIRSQGSFKSLQDGELVTIKGYANFNAPDSVKERLDPKSINTKRFSKNPILLFNHNMDYVIGKVVTIEPRDEGVWAEAQISTSSDPKISYIRDLVLDDVLKTFSVRFADEIWEEDPDNPGVRVAKNWELQELSIVSIPMQADSTFTVAKGILDGVKNLSEARSRIMNQKGRAVAALLNKRIAELEGSDGFNKIEFLRAFAVAAGVTEPELADVLSGVTTPVPNGVIQAAQEQLNLERAELDKAQGADAEAQQKGEVPMDPEHEDKPKDLQDPSMQKETVDGCVKEKIPLLMKEGKDQDQAVAMAISMCQDEKGCKVDYSDDEMKELMMYADSCEKGDAPDNMEPNPKEEQQQKADMPDMGMMTDLLQKHVTLMENMMEKVSALESAVAKLLEDEQMEDQEEGGETEDEISKKALSMEKEIEVLQTRLSALVS